MRSGRLSARQKFGLFYPVRLARDLPWLSLQMVPIIAYWIVKSGGADRLNWLVPLFIATTVWTLGPEPAQTFFPVPPVRARGPTPPVVVRVVLPSREHPLQRV